jgi:hypothetical protein
MSDKSVDEILAEVRSSTAKARGEKTDKGSGGNVLKSMFKTYIYDSGENVPPAVVMNEDGAFDEMPKFQVDTADPSDLSVKPFTDIYAEAGLQSAYSVDELDAMVNSAELADQPLNLKLVAVPFALKQKGVTIDEPIEDAAKRDAALDGYALMLSKRAYRGRNENEDKVAAIEAELKRIFAEKQAEIDSLRSDSAKKDNEYQTFMQRKAEEERRMAAIISPFITAGKANPVTVGNLPDDEERLVELKKMGKVAVLDKEGKIVGEQG